MLSFGISLIGLTPQMFCACPRTTMIWNSFGFFFCVQWFKKRGNCSVFVHIDEIVDYHCLIYGV
jgi:hypothetical protein